MEPATMATTTTTKTDVNKDIESILIYWFGQKSEWRGGLWFHGIDDQAIDTSKSGISQRQAKKSAQLTTDQHILQTFGPIITEIMTDDGLLKSNYEHTEWKTTPTGKIALIILLDQFTRNSYRGTSRMFFYDSYASSLALSLLNDPIFVQLPWNYKLFLYICLTHSEQEVIVNTAAIGLSSLINEFNEKQENLKFVKKLTRVLHATTDHLTVLQRFGRYPHRNYLLNRENTPEEEVYLSGPLPTWARSVGNFHAPVNKNSSQQSSPLPLVPHENPAEDSDTASAPAILPPPRPTRKPSVLVLHSSKQNPISFIKATRKIFGEESVNSLGYHCKISVLPATHTYTPTGEAKEALDGIENPTSRFNRCWWNATDDPSTMIYEGLEETIANVDRYCLLHGPFDGVVGFSQGGCLAGILAYLQQIQSPLVQNCKFQFVVIISGFACRDTRPEFNMSSRPPIPIHIPSFHSWGAADTLVINSRSECLSNWFVNPVIKTHVGGHFFGAISLWPILQIIEWINSLPLFPRTDGGMEGEGEGGRDKKEEGEGGRDSLFNDKKDPFHSNQSLTFDEKYELTKLKNDLLFSVSYNYTSKNYQSNKKRDDIQLLKPYGLTSPSLLNHQVWKDLVLAVPIHETKHITQETINLFVNDVIQDHHHEIFQSMELFHLFVGDLSLLAYCLYPYPEYAPYQERTRSKLLRLATQGEVFYWLYLRILQLILDSHPSHKNNNSQHTSNQQTSMNKRSQQELVRFYLEKLVEIGDWNDLFRLDLLICSGTSVKVIHSDLPSSSTNSTPVSGIAEENTQPIPKKSEMVLSACNRVIHDIIINLTVSRLCLDIQILKSKSKKLEEGVKEEQSHAQTQAQGEGREQGGEAAVGDDYDELVYKKLELSLENDKLLSCHTAQRVSDCVKYCPRLKSYTEKSTGLTSLIAYRLYHRMNGSGLVTNDDLHEADKEAGAVSGAGDGTGEADPSLSSSFVIHIPPVCRNYYRYVIRQLSDHHASLSLLSKDHLSLLKSKVSQQWKIKAYATCSEEEYQALVLSTPLSSAILHPEPEPVDVATSEEMSQLYQFFQSQHEEYQRQQQSQHSQHQQRQATITSIATTLLQQTEQIFQKGTLCSDGRLDLCKQVVGPQGVPSLMNSLLLDSLGTQSVQHLLLGNNICGNGLGEAVGLFIKSGQSAVTTWYIAGNRLTHEGIQTLCEALVEDTKVSQLWLKRNPLHVGGAVYLRDMLRVNSTLLVLDLVNTGLGDEGGRLILSSLYNCQDGTSTPTNHTLQHLYLDGNGFTSMFAHDLQKYFLTSLSSSLITLSIGCNRFGNEGIIAISSSLHSNTTLQRLGIASVGMGASGGYAIATLLKLNASLRHLDMGLLKFTAVSGEFPNRIGTEGAIAIAHSLKYSNKTLYSLLLLNNNIHQQGISALRGSLLDSYDDSVTTTVSMVVPNEGEMEKKVIQTWNQTLIKLELEQMGVPFNELTREEIRLALRRNYLSLTEKQKLEAGEALVPSHLAPIQSVYRTNGSYTK